jgi:U3 small nucleolar RNA-associated protein 14
MMENENVREAFNEMMREKNTLKQRAKGMNKKLGADSDSEDYDDDDVDMSEDELKRKAIGDIENEI